MSNQGKDTFKWTSTMNVHRRISKLEKERRYDEEDKGCNHAIYIEFGPKPTKKNYDWRCLEDNNARNTTTSPFPPRGSCIKHQNKHNQSWASDYTSLEALYHHDFKGSKLVKVKGYGDQDSGRSCHEKSGDKCCQLCRQQLPLVRSRRSLGIDRGTKSHRKVSFSSKKSRILNLPGSNVRLIVEDCAKSGDLNQNNPELIVDSPGLRVYASRGFDRSNASLTLEKDSLDTLRPLPLWLKENEDTIRWESEFPSRNIETSKTPQFGKPSEDSLGPELSQPWLCKESDDELYEEWPSEKFGQRKNSSFPENISEKSKSFIRLPKNSDVDDHLNKVAKALEKRKFLNVGKDIDEDLDKGSSNLPNRRFLRENRHALISEEFVEKDQDYLTRKMLRSGIVCHLQEMMKLKSEG